MRTAVKWGLMYWGLLLGLTALGHYNQQLNTQLRQLQAAEADLRRKETQLLLERYRMTSPLALREWAEANGYIPMSLARWQRSTP
ncbi:hypothetical protein [Meiothermus rufus]|uniref:hypothetical protein n=1 Tax=Meiothermus rufus TaxID=604332 RepID=UPI0004807A80|nr:hypothetical protein [Meiothermus rufus]